MDKKARFSRGFSLVELLISLIAISLILAALAPLITKKTKGTTAVMGNTSEISTECSQFGDNCSLCTKQKCLDCSLSICASTEYINTKTCECESCASKFDSHCLTCTSNECTKCESSKYYLNEDYICTSCPSGSYCDGAQIYDSCPNVSGYYCDDDGVHLCSDKYSAYCASCNSTECLTCVAHYYKENGDCKQCYSYFSCQTCTDGNKGSCTSCNSDWVRVDGVCTTTCRNVISNCLTCNNSSTTCAKCEAGYYVNSSKTCTKCDITNCLACSSATSCTTCTPGYYSTSSGSCSECPENCSTCTSSSICTSCEQGYHLEDNSCVEDDNDFNCSDSNFMQIGNICITRKNMGDSNTLTIPSTVIIASATDSEKCYAFSGKCCWQGSTTGSGCNGNNGSYSGCYRTVCNWAAANEICSNFNYAGKTWRLMTKEELGVNYLNYSAGLGDNGLMLCDLYTSEDNIAVCTNKTLYYSYDNTAYASSIWGDEYSGDYAFRGSLYGGSFSVSTVSKAYIFGVRCVADM